MSDRWQHLAARFFSSIGHRRPLSSAERAHIELYLASEAEADLFWSQPALDQHHGLESLQRIESGSRVRPELARAALFHDVGKRHANLGILGRVLAWLAVKFHLPLRGSLRAFHDHGALGAADLRSAGCEQLVIEFAEHHHGDRPPTIEQVDWDDLTAADR